MIASVLDYKLAGIRAMRMNPGMSNYHQDEEMKVLRLLDVIYKSMKAAERVDHEKTLS